MEHEDHRAMCQHVDDPYFHRCLCLFGQFNTGQFLKPMELMSKSENQLFYTELQCAIRNEFSGYYLRQQTPENDAKLYQAICIMRLGPLPLRRRGAATLASFEINNSIDASEIYDHEYVHRFRIIFSPFLDGFPLQKETIASWLDIPTAYGWFCHGIPNWLKP